MAKKKKATPVAAETESPAAAEGAVELEEEQPAEPGPEQLLAEKEAEARQLREQLLYAHAELENFKKRTEKRYREMLDYAAEPLLKDLMPVLDNLERASAHAHEEGGEGFAALLEGLDHVLSQFGEVLSRHGAEPVSTAGARFDPAVHEAMAQVPGEADGMVADVYEKGYRFKARLLRPAKVTVTKVASPSGDG
jgi:molecular chaperone GrpE